MPDENPSIGIIICKNKDKMYVEYALKNINAPIGVATYQLRNTLPEEMKSIAAGAGGDCEEIEDI